MTRPFTSECYATIARRMTGILSNVYNEALKGCGLNISQFSLLRNLERIGSGNLTEWANAAGIERTTMVRNVKALMDASFIEMLEGRGKVFRLSEKGEEALKQAQPYWKRAQKRVEKKIGTADADALLRIGESIQRL